jgi:hypothetical protein
VAKKQKGGPMPGSGRRSYFRNKHAGGGVQHGIWFTTQGADELDANVARLNRTARNAIPIGRSVFVEALVRRYGSKLTFSDLAKMADGEWRSESETT